MTLISELMIQEYRDNFFIELGTPCQDYLENKIDFKTFQKLIKTCYENWGSRTTLELNQKIADLIEDIETDYFSYDEPGRDRKIKEDVKNFIDPIEDQFPIFGKNDKRRMYWLINQYASNRLKARDFCNQFNECHDLKIDRHTLTELEEKAFSDLSTVTGRFSPYGEEGAYTQEELKQQIIETKKMLQQQSASMNQEK